VNLTVLVPELAGTVTPSLTDPLEQGTVAGRPATAGLEEKTQLTAFVTSAERVTGPPAELSEDGVATKEETLGTGVLTSVEAAEGEADAIADTPARQRVRAALMEASRATRPLERHRTASCP
jgi:hypothetical protein